MKFGVEIPFVTHLGFELLHFEGGESTLQFSPRPEHQNSFGVAHGGAIMTLMDVTMASAARSVAPEMGVVTIEMKTSFMRPTPGDGSTLTGRGVLMQRTASMAFVEAKLYDSQGNVCAHSTGTFKYVKRPDTNTVRAGLPANQPSTD
ncbi:MAG: PaaI family thioesterase [Polaromonas sp.]|nr:PaaI family thioesterase [Polaromonas sp.]